MGSSAWTRRRGQGSIDSGNCVRVALEKLCPNLCLPANSINYDRERHDSPEALAGYGFGGSLSSSVVSGRIPSKLLILHPPAFPTSRRSQVRVLHCPPTIRLLSNVVAGVGGFYWSSFFKIVGTFVGTLSLRLVSYVRVGR